LRAPTGRGPCRRSAASAGACGRLADGADRLHTATDQSWKSTGPLPPDWSELIPELDRQAADIVVLKRQWGAFYGTDLDLQLRRRRLATIVICGIATEFGVESTARDACERGYELIFAEDAMIGMTAESHLNSVERIFPAWPCPLDRCDRRGVQLTMMVTLPFSVIEITHIGGIVQVAALS